LKAFEILVTPPYASCTTENAAEALDENFPTQILLPPQKDLASEQYGCELGALNRLNLERKISSDFQPVAARLEMATQISSLQVAVVDQPRNPKVLLKCRAETVNS